jgi:hypothetical protein
MFSSRPDHSTAFPLGSLLLFHALPLALHRASLRPTPCYDARHGKDFHAAARRDHPGSRLPDWMLVAGEPRTGRGRQHRRRLEHSALLPRLRVFLRRLRAAGTGRRCGCGRGRGRGGRRRRDPAARARLPHRVRVPPDVHRGFGAARRRMERLDPAGDGPRWERRLPRRGRHRPRDLLLQVHRRRDVDPRPRQPLPRLLRRRRELRRPRARPRPPPAHPRRHAGHLTRRIHRARPLRRRVRRQRPRPRHRDARPRLRRILRRRDLRRRRLVAVDRALRPGARQVHRARRGDGSGRPRRRAAAPTRRSTWS